MKSFGELRTDFLTISKNDDAENSTLGGSLINYFTRKILILRKWTFNNGSSEISTVASQQYYQLPNNCGKVNGVKVLVGSTTYTPREVVGEKEWRRINKTSHTSTIPQLYHIDEQDRIGFFPITSADNDTITVYFKKKIKNLSAADYAIGTISITHAATAVVGDSTAFTVPMAYRWLKVDDDGFWYEISAYTDSTHLSLRKIFEGVTVSDGAFTIGEMIPLPDGFEDLPLWASLAAYFRMRGEMLAMAREYETLFKEGLANLIRMDSRSESGFLESEQDLEDEISLINPNSVPQDLNQL